MEINIDVNSNKMVIKNEGNEFVINLGGETSSEDTNATSKNVVEPKEVAGLNELVEPEGTKVTMGNEVLMDTTKDTKVIKEANDTKVNLADYVVTNEGSGNYPDESIVEDVLNLYYNTDKTGTQITEELGISTMDLYRYLEDYGHGANRMVRAKKSEVKPKVIAMCKSGKYKTITQIAEEVGVAQVTVSKYLKEEGLSVRPSKSGKRKKATYGRRVEFKKKYYPLVIAEYEKNPTETQANIADTLDISPATVGRYIKEYQDSKPAESTNVTRSNKQAVVSEANRKLGDLHKGAQIGYEVLSGYSLEDIKDKYDIAGSTPVGLLVENGIITQDRTEEFSRSLVNFNEMYPQVIDLYNNTNLSISEIATKLDLYENTVCLYITKYEEEKVAVY